MKFSKIRMAGGAALLACSLLAHAAINLNDTLPVGPQVKVGKLANGLTYYIQKNGKPEKKVELRLVVKAGSILEDEDQQGLAHFTEHMAFNGSAHFRKNELVSYLQSIGVKFGADLNAYTSFDETVYILPIPTDKRENLDKGFLVLEDWAQGLSMRHADIDSERAIVLEELRLGKGAQDRMNKVLMPKLVNGSRYAQRMPIGKEHILQTFKYDAIKRFYRDWYRPNLMAVMVVGDIEPDEAEKMIRRHFSKLKNPRNERPRVYAKVPLRTQSEGVVITDKEASNDLLLIRYQVQPMANLPVFADYRDKMIETLYGEMLGARMQELAQQENPPFIQGGSNMGKLVRGYQSFNAYAVLGKTGAAPAIDALVQEEERVRRFGFSESELDRSKKNMLRSYERAYQEREKSDSAGYVAEYVRHFLEQEPIPGIENEFNYSKELLPLITLDDVNRAIRKALPANEKKLVVYMGSDKADSVIPSGAELMTRVDAAEKMDVLQKQEKALAGTLMTMPPQAGAIVAEKENQALGLTELTLSNGVTVILKPTDFKNDQILMSSSRFGGQSLYGGTDIENARYAASVVAQMGVGDFTPLDLQKILAGKTVGAGAYLNMLSEGVEGSAGKDDLETLLQLTYLRFTAPRKDEALFRSFVSKQRDLAKNTLSRPEALFYDTVQTTLYNGHPRVVKAARPEDFDQLVLDRMLEIYKQRFASARGATFFFVGNFEVAAIKPLIATYLASLPGGEIGAAYQDLGVRPVKGVVRNAVFKGTEPKSNISITFHGAVAYADDEQLKLQTLIEVLNIKLTEVLREQQGLIYGGGMHALLDKLPYGHYSIGVNLPTGPGNVDKVIAATFAEVQKMKDHGPLAADLAKVKQNWTQSNKKSLRENAYWMSKLRAALSKGRDPATILTFETRLAAITPEQLRETAQRYFDMDNYVQVVLYPEKK